MKTIGNRLSTRIQTIKNNNYWEIKLLKKIKQASTSNALTKLRSSTQ